MTSHPSHLARLPVRIYQSEDRIMVAAPLPGLEPENIQITVVGTRVIIQGEERGPGQHARDLLLAEWTIGPYYRELTLPQPVNGVLTNATYSNGILILAMPKLEAEQAMAAAEFRLQTVRAPTHGEHIGHTGSSVFPTTMQDHLQKHQAENALLCTR